MSGLLSLYKQFNRYIIKNMTQQEAINILINVAKLAQKAGALSLDDAVVVKSAIDAFVKPQEEVETPPKGTGQAPIVEPDKSIKSVEEMDAEDKSQNL